ncbi:hypothetical protein [Halococcus sp. PRR34]|uniref:hypothetical protein n=1 Tax=Halococcus sp. PRR34 TaxID=3020830 RepID=UPI00235FCDB7|nr:hypothetical protein [Halococcus sp. PRR34]
MSEQSKLDEFISPGIPAVDQLSFSRLSSSLEVRPPEDGEERDELIEEGYDLVHEGDDK